MLRICYSRQDSLQQWTLCGRLAGRWVQELRSCWELAPAEPRTLVDLSDVTFIDEGGERLLADMRQAGVDFVATGVETKDLVDNLKPGGEQHLRRLVKGGGEE